MMVAIHQDHRNIARAVVPAARSVQNRLYLEGYFSPSFNCLSSACRSSVAWSSAAFSNPSAFESENVFLNC